LSLQLIQHLSVSFDGRILGNLVNSGMKSYGGRRGTEKGKRFARNSRSAQGLLLAKCFTATNKTFIIMYRQYGLWAMLKYCWLEQQASLLT